MSVGDDLRPSLPRETVSGKDRLPGVKDVQPAAAAAELDDLATQGADQVNRSQA
jgi:hypothetical protein